MHADSYFTIGKTHTVCEDYTLSGNNCAFPFIILSDGCSSSKHTDVGSRILAHCCATKLRQVDPLKIDSWDTESRKELIEFNIKGCIWQADLIRRNLGLSDECLDSTLLSAISLPNELAISFNGDGIFALKSATQIQIVQVDYLKNAPQYLSYQLDLLRNINYEQDFGSRKKITSFIINLVTNELNIIETKSEVEPLCWYFYKPEFEVVALFSDGLQTFRSTRDLDLVSTYSVIDIVKSLLDFKTLKGNFVQRRCKRFLKDCAEKNIYHDDDFSMAAIILKD